jgi:hypothetical protein
MDSFFFFKKDHYESLGSLTRGNFLEMLKLLALCNEIGARKCFQKKNSKIHLT